VGLDAASALHARTVVALAHDHEMEPPAYAAARRAGVTIKILQALVDVELWGGRGAFEATRLQEEGVSHRALAAFDRVLCQIDAEPGSLRLVRTVEDIGVAKDRGQLGIVLGMEGGRALEASLEVLRCYFRMGVRHVQFNWGVPNRIAACHHQSGADDTGLSEFGRALVGEMNRLGMVMDTAHSSQQTRLQTFRLSAQPVIHSHAGAYALTPMPQNLNDEELRALARNDGVIGLHLMSHLLRSKGQATVDDLCAHIDYISRVAGMRHIALGPDFLRNNTVFAESTNQPGLTYVREVASVDRLLNLTRALLERGYREEDVAAILGGNLVRVLQAILSARS
jgi:membrane dipeptidase